MKRTLLVSPESAGDSSPSQSGYRLLATVGSFTKDSAFTAVEIDWNGNASAATSNGGLFPFCDFQVRIDGGQPDDDAGRAVLGPAGGFGTPTGATAPTGVTALFSNVAAGVHLVQIYDRGEGVTYCGINAGNFPDTFLVKEEP